MNYITIDGELVTPKTEAMAYEQTNHRMDTLEQNIQNDFAGVRQEITETVNSIGNEMEVLSDRINSDISSVEGRIDNIIAHNNDTEGNSELVDIRTGVDGTVYASAGTAVREQINDINDNLDDYFNFPNNIINFRTAQFADRANAGIIWGTIKIDTIKETVIYSNISKRALPEIQKNITSFMIEAKKKYKDKKDSE